LGVPLLSLSGGLTNHHNLSHDAQLPVDGSPYAAFAASFGRLEDRCP
jgi:hypothetical protein